MTQERAQWKSRLGFILAASGSAIGLGNIVMFSSSAYRYGGGAFYVPYLLALFLVGIPVMVAEFGLGAYTKKSFPLAMRAAGGRAGEFAGWFAVLNAGFIMLYYVTILGWVLGMLIQSIQMPDAAAGFAPGNSVWNDLTLGYLPMGCVLVVWIINYLLVCRGTKTIEIAVKFFVPLMWVAMLVLVGVGCTLHGGFEGMKVLFTPEPSVLGQVDVWRGAASQMFFTLSLGFGIMTAYASYLPKHSDHTHNAITTSLLNCGFEWIAGVAIFAMLFAFSQLPSQSTIGMMFVVVPSGIASLPTAVHAFAIAFFALLLIAGLTSSISMTEAFVAAVHDKYGGRRHRILRWCTAIGFLGSLCFALPLACRGDVSLGVMLLDMTDHWAFGYGLLFVGIVECLIIGWLADSRRIRAYINEHSRFRLGIWWDVLLRFVLPIGLGVLLVGSILENDIEPRRVYGDGVTSAEDRGFLTTLVEITPYIVFGSWALVVFVGSWLLSKKRDDQTEDGGGSMIAGGAS